MFILTQSFNLSGCNRCKGARRCAPTTINANHTRYDYDLDIALQENWEIVSWLISTNAALKISVVTFTLIVLALIAIPVAG